jgi:branched-chain amino acid transport system ATP-binding protein
VAQVAGPVEAGIAGRGGRIVTPRLALEHVAVRFGGLAAVRDLSLAVAPGEIRGLIGPNGAGKTTAINAVTGAVRVVEGRIALDGENIANEAPHRISRRGVARTFQHVEAFADMSVLDNVLVAVGRRQPVPLWAAALATPGARRAEASARAEAEAILDAFALLPYRDDRAADLPFGLLKRMDLARALAVRPRLLLLDEPTSGMSEGEADSAIAAVRRIAEHGGITMLVIEHNMRVMMALADSVTVMQNGAVIAEGAPAEIRKNAAVIEAYLGEAETDAAH